MILPAVADGSALSCDRCRFQLSGVQETNEDCEIEKLRLRMPRSCGAEKTIQSQVEGRPGRKSSLEFQSVDEQVLHPRERIQDCTGRAAEQLCWVSASIRVARE